MEPTLGQSVGALSSEAEISELRQSAEIYLEVLIGGRSTHVIVSFRKQGAEWRVQSKDLEDLGVDLARSRPSAAVSASNDWVDMGALTGISYRVDEPHQTIDLTIDDALRKPYAIGRQRAAPPPAIAGKGLIVNYDLYGQTTGTPASGSIALSSEQRWFSPVGVLSNAGIAMNEAGDERYVRASTSYQIDDAENMTTYAAGDAVSSALGWSRSVRVGGFQISRNFSLQPNLITFPVPELAGSAALPSTVDLYVNGVRQLSSQVPSGPFLINGAGTVTGAGLATVVVRDAMGRAVSTSLPLYVDNRLLAAGLSSFSVEGGLLRYGYGLDSFDYSGHPVMSGTYRLGVSDWLTMESHGEATPQLVDSGIGALVRLGEAGVINAALAGSTDSASSGTMGSGAVGSGTTGSGTQATLGYQIITMAFSLSAQTTYAFGRYADLAAIGGTPAPRYLDQITASVPCPHEQTIGSSWVRLNDSVAGRSNLVQLWYSARLNRSMSTFANVSRDFEQPRSASLSLGVSLDFGNRISGYSSAGTSGGRGEYDASVTRSADYGGGWEWAAQSERSAGSAASLVRGGYLGQYGEVVAAAQDAGGHDAISIEAIGAAVFMDGALEPARHIGAGFAMVSTDGIEGVPVLHENRLLGTTDASGHLLVPDLNPYEHNSLAIDPLDLPAEDKIPVDHLDVTPRGGSGVLARFPIDRYRAGTVALFDVRGRPLPAGTAIHLVESDRDFVVGYDGIAFLEGLAADNHLIARGPDFECRASVSYGPHDGAKGFLVDLGKVTCKAEGRLST